MDPVKKFVNTMFEDLFRAFDSLTDNHKKLHRNMEKLEQFRQTVLLKKPEISIEHLVIEAACAAGKDHDLEEALAGLHMSEVRLHRAELVELFSEGTVAFAEMYLFLVKRQTPY